MLLALLALAAAVGSVRMETLYVVAPIMAGLDALFTASFVAYLPSLVSERSLVSANTARATSSAAADVTGPAAAGALIGAFGAAFAIGLDAVSFLASVGGATRRARESARRGHRASPSAPLTRSSTAGERCSAIPRCEHSPRPRSPRTSSTA